MPLPPDTSTVARLGAAREMRSNTTFIFGPYFVSRLTADPVSAQAMWSNMATVSSVIIAVLSPVLGSIADQSGARKPWIGFFAVIKIASLFGLWFAAPGSPILYPVIFMTLACTGSGGSGLSRVCMIIVAPMSSGKMNQGSGVARSSIHRKKGA